MHLQFWLFYEYSYNCVLPDVLYIQNVNIYFKARLCLTKFFVCTKTDIIRSSIILNEETFFVCPFSVLHKQHKSTRLSTLRGNMQTVVSYSPYRLQIFGKLRKYFGENISECHYQRFRISALLFLKFCPLCIYIVSLTSIIRLVGNTIYQRTLKNTNDGCLNRDIKHLWKYHLN